MRKNQKIYKPKDKYFLLIIVIQVVFLFFLNSCGLVSESLRESSLKSQTNLSQQASVISENTPAASEERENIKKKEEAGHLVTKVIDGDTLIADNIYSVRLIGINAPEAGMYFYEEAKQYLEFLIDNKKVYLESDITDKDKYGRLLRYAFDENFFVNYEMVKYGFANAFDYKPDSRYSNLLKEAEEYAQKNQKGIWEKACIGDIEIKINYDAKGRDEENLNGEWVEIINNGSSRIKLKGWTIKDLATNIYTFKDVILYPESRIFLFTGKGKDEAGRLYWNADRPVWNNDHDSLYLRNSAGKLVKYINY